jgi:eukaryotic-like serine/threonine-protein kinase
MIAPAPALVETLAAAGYEVVDHLHRSRGFDVFDGWSTERRARVVIKTPRPDRIGDRILVRRLEREGRLLRDLSHPNILRGYEVIRGPVPAIVTETLRGQTLSHLLDNSQRLTAAEAAVLGLQLSSAVAYLHDYGYLHLELKPSNIVVDCGRANVVDLSIARKPGRGIPGLGTWQYLAPEQALGRRLDAAADVWGVGAVLFEVLTGRPPFEESDDPSAEKEYPQLEAPAPKIRTLRRLPSPLADAVDACLDPDPARRPTIAELVAALERVPGAGSPRSAGTAGANGRP